MNDVFKDFRNNGETGNLSIVSFASSFIPFSNKGFSNAILHVFDNLDNFIVRLHTFLIGLAKAVAPSFKNLPPILSIPSNFAGLISAMSFRTTL